MLIFAFVALTLIFIFTPNFNTDSETNDSSSQDLSIDSNIESVKKQIMQSFNPEKLRYTLAKLYIRKAKSAKNSLELYTFYGNALAEFKKIIEQQDSFEVHMEIAKIHILLGYPKRSISHLSQAKEINPNDEQTQLLLGEALFKSKKYTRAKSELEGYLKRAKQQDVKAYLRLAQIEFYENDDQMALAKLQLALKRSPDNFEANFLLGEIHQKLHNLESAVLAYQRASDSDPRALSAHLKLGELYSYTQNYEKAKESYGKALLISPNSVEAQDGIGFANLGLEKFDEAETSFKRAATLDSKKASSFYGLGICEVAKNNLPLAVDYLATAFALDEDYREYATKDKYLEPLWEDEKFQKALKNKK